MTEPVLIALIAATPPTLMGAAALFVGFHNKNKLQALHIDVNSRLSQLIIASRAEGAQTERDKHTITVPGIPKENEG